MAGDGLSRLAKQSSAAYGAQARGLVRSVTGRLASIPGIAAIAVGGSWARGHADRFSDIDFGLYYDPASPPAIARLRALARELDDRSDAPVVTERGGWGPWIDGGAWLEIGGRRVDWIYRDLSCVARAIADARKGMVSAHYQPGHPHAFHTHIYAGEVHDARIVHDPTGRLEALRRRTCPYPAALTRAVRGAFLWEARFALETARASARRGDVFHVSGSLFRSAACLVQVLFAVNQRYLVNEKGALRAAETLPLAPPGFSRRVRRLLARPGNRAPDLERSVSRMAVLADETADLAGSASL
jgi:predicted nucleotidyltransferase